MQFYGRQPMQSSSSPTPSIGPQRPKVGTIGESWTKSGADLSVTSD